MKAAVLRERPFEFLKRKGSNEAFPEQTVADWYMARAYVLDCLKDVAFVPGMPGHLHVIVDGDSPLMLSVVRFLCLYAHYLNYVEYDMFGNKVCRNRTVITIISAREGADIVSELEKEEYLSNLLQVCRYSVAGKVFNEDSYIDIDIEIVKECGDAADAIRITEDDVKAFVADRPQEEVFSIDTRKAIYASHAYILGGVIDNLPHEDIFGAGRYVQALDTFRYLLFNDTEARTLVTPAWENSPVTVRNGISDIMCTDCFESRERAVVSQYPAGRLSEKERRTIWERNNYALSLSEHCRWVVEKLIMGFRPYSNLELNKYETLFGSEKSSFCKQMKKDAADPAHLDLCSYWDLRRIDPDNLKYDSFLMLAIPLILGKVRQ